MSHCQTTRLLRSRVAKRGGAATLWPQRKHQMASLPEGTRPIDRILLPIAPTRCSRGLRSLLADSPSLTRSKAAGFGFKSGTNASVVPLWGQHPGCKVTLPPPCRAEIGRTTGSLARLYTKVSWRSTHRKSRDFFSSTDSNNAGNTSISASMCSVSMINGGTRRSTLAPAFTKMKPCS